MLGCLSRNSRGRSRWPCVGCGAMDGHTHGCAHAQGAETSHAHPQCTSTWAVQHQPTPPHIHLLAVAPVPLALLQEVLGLRTGSSGVAVDVAASRCGVELAAARGHGVACAWECSCVGVGGERCLREQREQRRSGAGSGWRLAANESALHTGPSSAHLCCVVCEWGNCERDCGASGEGMRHISSPH
jgi:hypothetical protein